MSRPDLVLLDAISYLSLLGHFRFAEFDQIIQEVWRQHQDEVLPYAIWAAARCPLQEVDKVLGPLLERLASLIVRNDDTENQSEEKWMTLQLGWGFRRGITPQALAYLLIAGRQNQSLRREVSLMVEGVDHPDAVEFLVRDAAEGGWSSLWPDLTGIGDGEPKILLRSAQTTDRLRELWRSPGESDKVRTRAFCRWLQTTGGKDVALLRTIESDSPYHRYAVQHRIKLGDPSVVSLLLSLLRADDLEGWWWVLAHRVWCNELRSFASETLAGFQGKIPTDFTGRRMNHLHLMAQLLVKVPVPDAEGLLLSHSGHLKYSPYMIHAAFRIGTLNCLALAREAMSLCPADVDIFDLAFSSVWSQKNDANPITLHHLKSLEPYLDCMTPEEVRSLARHTERAVGSDEEIAGWISKHLLSRFPPANRSSVEGSDESLTSYLDRSFQETGFEPYLGFLFDEREGQRFVSPMRMLRLLDGWLSTHLTIRGLKVAAACLTHIGTRWDLDLMNRYPIEGNAAEIEQIKADARFSIWKRSLV